MCTPDATGGRPRGLMLVELMVGLSIGLMVVAAAGAATVFTLRAAAAGQDAAELQQRADAALMAIGRQVRQAGSVQLLDEAPRVRFSNQFKGWRDTGPAVSVLEGGPGRPDTLRLSYQHEPVPKGQASHDSDCLGYPSKAGNRTDSEFFIDAGKVTFHNRALYCRGTQGTPEPLIHEVHDLQLQFAIRDEHGEPKFLDADVLPAGVPLLALSVCLQLASEGRHGAPDSRDCQGCPARQQGRLMRLVRAVYPLHHAP